MPADSQFVVATIPLTRLSTKADLFGRKVGLAPEAPINLEEMLAGELGISGMIDGSRGAGLAIGGPNSDLGMQSMVGYLPVRDAKGAMAQLKAAGATDAPGTVDVCMTATGMCVKASGKYLLVAAVPQALAGIETRPKGVELSSADKAIFSSADVAATGKLAGVMPMVQGLAMMQMMSDPKMQQHPSLMAIAQMGMARLTELESVTLAGGLLAEGVRVDVNMAATPGSALAGFLSKHPPTTLAPLDDLPKDVFLQAGVVSLGSKALMTPINAILDALASDPTIAGKVDQADLAKAKGLLEKMVGLTTSGCTAQYPAGGSTGATGGMGPVSIEVGKVKDWDQFTKAMTEFCPVATRLLEQFGFSVPLTYKSAAGTAGGLSYDEVAVDCSKLPVDPATLQQMALQWGGTLTLTEQFCQVKNDLVAMGVGPGALEQAVVIAKKPGGLGQQPNILATAKALPSKANAFVFLDVGAFVKSGMGGNPQMAMMAPMLAQLQGTMGAAVTMTSGRCRMRMFVPTELVKGGVATVQQFMGMAAMMSAPPTQPGPGGTR